jgi:hypothetical protein
MRSIFAPALIEAVSRTPGEMVKSVIVAGSLMFATLRLASRLCQRNTGHSRPGFSMPAKTISVAGISAEGIRGKMIFLAFRVKPLVKLP